MFGGFRERWERYGRAVPPLMMFELASCVRDQLLKRDRRRVKVLAQGIKYAPYLMADVRAIPRNGYTVISTFSGCGGSSLGYKLAGFDVRCASEFDREAAETYEANFPGVPVLRAVWQQQYIVSEGQLRMRTAEELAPAGERIITPYDPA